MCPVFCITASFWASFAGTMSYTMKHLATVSIVLIEIEARYIIE